MNEIFFVFNLKSRTKLGQQPIIFGIFSALKRPKTVIFTAFLNRLIPTFDPLQHG